MTTTSQFWLTVRQEPSGEYTAQAVGIPEIRATRSTREDAISLVQNQLRAMIADGNLVSIELVPRNPLLEWAGRRDPNHPEEQAFLAELARAKQEDLENTLRELDRECSEFLLDTDHLTLLDHGNLVVMQRMAIQPAGTVGLPAVTIEEYLRGRFAAIAQAKDGATRILTYKWFVETLRLIHPYPVADYNQDAEDEYQHIRTMRLRIGTRDQKIAAIALSLGATLVTRNARDFARVPGLQIADWSI